MEEEIVFCKIQDLRKSYYLFTTVKDNGKDGFHLILYDGNDSWEGDISGDDIEEQCSLTNMDYKNYVEATVQALTGISYPHTSFQYQVDHSSDDSIEFHWKKYIVKDDIKFRLGSTKLRPRNDNNKTVQKIFDHCIEKISNLNDKITSTQKDNERLSQERANALKRLDGCVSAKEKLEKDLYSKFLLVLNSKKKEIKRLRERVENQHCDSQKADNSNSDVEFVDENSRAYSVETDKDESEDEKKPGGKKKAKLNDDSLVFTDDSLDEDMDILPRKLEMKKPGECSKAKKNPSESKVVKIKEERQSPMFENKSSLDMSGLLDDF